MGRCAVFCGNARHILIPWRLQWRGSTSRDAWSIIHLSAVEVLTWNFEHSALLQSIAVALVCSFLRTRYVLQTRGMSRSSLMCLGKVFFFFRPLWIFLASDDLCSFLLSLCHSQNLIVYATLGTKLKTARSAATSIGNQYSLKVFKSATLLKVHYEGPFVMQEYCSFFQTLPKTLHCRELLRNPPQTVPTVRGPSPAKASQGSQRGEGDNSVAQLPPNIELFKGKVHAYRKPRGSRRLHMYMQNDKFDVVAIQPRCLSG